MRAVHEVPDLALPRARIDEWCIAVLRDRPDHPWIGSRRGEVMDSVDRLEAVIERARAIDVPHVVCHHDLFPHNILVDRDGQVTALVDWGHVALAPREHDLFTALCRPDPVRFLRAYGARDLNRTHLEYARLARSLRDIATRLENNVDRRGIDTWGFDQLRRVDADLALVEPFCVRL
jgi:aminoglycoside phosphotransferase (APT) family kinase protein